MEDIILSAIVNKYIAEIDDSFNREGLMYIPNYFKLNDKKIGYRNVEIAAIAKSINYVKKFEEEVIYENTVSMKLHGIDMITKANSKYIFYEIKGTTKKLRTPKYYLKKTKNKGRQLSWFWCWKSVCEMAYLPMTALVFLDLFKYVINKKIERKLIVVECEKLEDNSFIGKKVNIFNVDYIFFHGDYNFTKEKNFLKLRPNIVEEMEKIFIEQILNLKE